ncbi:MAG: UbiA family prenyltransferase [Methanomassiliicoccales archaeon]|nr:UbiA family prenyltransferase [Methanomassiliicoccales archaeon]
MNQYLQLFRLGNCIMGVVGLLLGALIAAGSSLLDSWTMLAVGSAVVFAFVAGGNSLNDYYDREVDKIAHPERPIPSGRMKPETALRLSISAFAISIFLAIFLNLTSIVIVASAVLVMLLYETHTKRAGLSGNLSIAWLTGALFLLGGAVVGHVDQVVVIAAMAFLATLGREIVKDIQDMEADFDRLTLPKRIGKRNAGAVGSLAFLSAVALSPLPYLAGFLDWPYLVVVLAADAIFIYCAIVHFRSPKQGQYWAKIGMIVALIAFLVGGIL